MNSFANLLERNHGNLVAAVAQFAHKLDAPDALNSAVVAAKLEGFYPDHWDVEASSVSLNQKRDNLKRIG